ncbi:MAG TPA: hypothetical protein VER12_08870 [Polyangiaceae bacterium]|nr:hypothetical protein [Polyangiaceae bacterium]
MTISKSAIKGGRVFLASRLRTLSGLILATGSLLAACHKQAPEKPRPAAVVVKKSPEELKKLADSATESLEGLKPSLTALNDKFKALHVQFDPLPPDLPDFEQTRGKFNSADEGLGRMNAKIPWLASKVDAAVKAGDGAELEDISKSIANTYADIPQVNQVAMELLHEVRPFIKMAEQYEANKKASCESDTLDTNVVSKKLSAH